jgi:hypothetical protein
LVEVRTSLADDDEGNSAASRGRKRTAAKARHIETFFFMSVNVV